MGKKTKANERGAKPPGAFEANAQHGQNRTGVEVEGDVTFDEFESSRPVDPRAADERLCDEGPEIRARVHDRGHDVLSEPDATDPDYVDAGR